MRYVGIANQIRWERRIRFKIIVTDRSLRGSLTTRTAIGPVLVIADISLGSCLEPRRLYPPKPPSGSHRSYRKIRSKINHSRYSFPNPASRFDLWINRCFPSLYFLSKRNKLHVVPPIRCSCVSNIRSYKLWMEFSFFFSVSKTFRICL